MRAPRTLLAASAALAAAVSLSACGASNTADTSAGHHARSHAAKTVTDTVTRPAQSTPTPTSTKQSSTPTSTQPAHTTTAVAAECSVDDLVPKQVSSNGAAGTIVFVYTLTNSSSSPCFTYGWPGVGYIGLDGRTLPTIPRRVTRDMVGSVGQPTKFTIVPGAQGSFRVTLSDVTSSGGGGCLNAAAIEITPPNETRFLRLDLNPRIATCGEGTVTPMQPGTGAEHGTA